MIINCLNISQLSNDDYEWLRNEVSEERRIKADCFYFKIDSYRSVCAELLLQYSLFENNNQFVEIDLAYNKYGKPTIINNKNFFFNLSHSGDWVVLAYGTAEVGVDIEKIQMGRERISDEIFREEEREYIYSSVGMERIRRVTQIWTLRESYIKYLGTGFSTEMNTFSIDAVNNCVMNDIGELKKNIFIKSIIFEPDYFLSICSEEAMFTIKEVVLEDLMEVIYRKKRSADKRKLYGYSQWKTR